MRFAIAIPAYQAEPSIGAVVAAALEWGTAVLVIDDGSRDRTGAAAAAAGARVLRQEVNRGKGAALRRAFADLFAAAPERGFDGVVTVDADGQHLPSEIGKLLGPAGAGADLVLGVRDHLFAEMSALRRASNRLSSRAISWAAGCPIGDIQTGFRFYSRRLYAEVGFPEDRFEAESAVVVRAARRGLVIDSVPVRLGFVDGRTTSHYRPWVDSARIARAVIAARASERARERGRR